ncbi:MAG: glycosyltransferase family 39 protein [Candidatus Andersenbacteria bacterium]
MHRNTEKIAIIIGLLAMIIAPRIFDLDAFLTADEKRWVANTNGFVMKLAARQWDNLLQQPHPGITTQWFGAPTIFSDSWTIRKLPLVLAQSILVLLIGYIFWRLWGTLPAILLTLLLGLNPPLVAHTRVYAMDSLLALFLLLSLGCLLTWKKYQQWQYLVFAAGAAAAAILSKLPGILILPFTLLFLLWHALSTRRYRHTLRALALWSLILLTSLVLILPSLATNTQNVINEFRSFFDSDDYQELHQEEPTYYLRSLIFFSTPLQLFSLVLLPLTAIWLYYRQVVPKTQISRAEAIWLILFGISFVAMMSQGLKKGDRYVLPAFLIWDTVVVITVWWLLTIIRHDVFQLTSLLRINKQAGDAPGDPTPKHHSSHLAANYLPTLWIGGVVLMLILQAATLWQLHPYALAYVNPLTKPFFGERRLGWGEGLDLAALYLGAQPDSKHLKVAAYYPIEFSLHFPGEVVPAHQHEHESVDYIVLYRAMYERGPQAWETDVLQYYKDKTPEKVISLNGIEYVWIYSQSPSSHD